MDAPDDAPANDAPRTAPSPPATPGEALHRALRLRCPRCGEGKLFIGWFRMHPRCPRCDFRYERAPGYFLGSAYINYGATSVTITAAYLLLHLRLGYTNRQVSPFLIAFFLIFPLVFFRYARSLWLALDCYLDPSNFDPERK